MAQEKKYIPELRFPEFKNDGGWILETIGTIADTFSGGTPTVGNREYYGGDIPFIRSGEISNDKTELFITESGLSNSSAKMVDKGTILYAMYGATSGEVAISKISGAINQAILAIIPKSQEYNNRYIYHYLKHNKQYILGKYLQGGQGNLSANIINNLPIYFPCDSEGKVSIKEQQKIADCLSSLDEGINAIKHKVAQLKEHKKGLMQRLFPAKGETTPELRFPEFQHEAKWRYKSLGDITKIVNKRNRSKRILSIYSINNIDGFIPQEQQFDGIDIKARGYDISLYKIIGRNTFAYNPARINVGSIGYSGDLKDVLISSLYVCFKSIEGIDDNFLRCFFNSHIFNQAVESNVEGGIRSYLFYENFSRIKIPVPNLKEQKRIASCIMSVDYLIKLTEREVAILESHKSGLTQRLFLHL
ncbi:MAG: restriction endonuclease subunit S [Bacteroidales bacterium]|nr:restriction endonuclease subunit S [Bacteroidales bacterium]